MSGCALGTGGSRLMSSKMRYKLRIQGKLLFMVISAYLYQFLSFPVTCILSETQAMVTILYLSFTQTCKLALLAMY